MNNDIIDRFTEGANKAAQDNKLPPVTIVPYKGGVAYIVDFDSVGEVLSYVLASELTDDNAYNAGYAEVVGTIACSKRWGLD